MLPYDGTYSKVADSAFGNTLKDTPDTGILTTFSLQTMRRTALVEGTIRRDSGSNITGRLKDLSHLYVDLAAVQETLTQPKCELGPGGSVVCMRVSP